MNKFLRWTLAFMATVVLLLVLWVATPSSLFYNPVALKLEGETVTVVRDTPFGEVPITWIGEITLLDQDNFECSGSGNRIAQVEKGGVVSQRIGSWAFPCMAAGRPFVLRYQYQVYLFGIIPLRPVGISIRLDKEELTP